VGAVYQASVGSSAYESIRVEAAGICELFQSVERPQRGSKSEAGSSIRGRALGAQERHYASSIDENVQGVCTAFC